MTREEAIKRVKGYLTDYLPIDCYGEVEEIIKALKPKTGHWIKTSLTQVSGGDFKRGFKCSHCNYVIVTNDFNYCPNCGADMRGVEE